MSGNPTNTCPIPTENPIILDISESYGALLIGSFLSAAVWGVSTLQVFIYYMHSSSRDSAFLKGLVAFLWCTDTANQILTLKGTWKVLIKEYGRIAGLSENAVELLHHTWLEAIVIFAVQMYFLYRIYQFGSVTLRAPLHKVGLYVLCSTLSIAILWQIVGIVVYLAKAYNQPLGAQRTTFFIIVNISMRGVAVGVDIVIAACMVYLLTREGNHGLSKTKRIVHRLILIVVTSGTLTAVVVMFVLILIKVYQATLFYCILELALCSLYLSTLLANLNTRDYAYGQDFAPTTMSSFNAQDRVERNSTAMRTFGSGSGRFQAKLPGPKDSSSYSDRSLPHIQVQKNSVTDGDDAFESQVKTV